MIAAVMYGIMPRPNWLLWLRVPPVKIWRYSGGTPQRVVVSRVCESASMAAC
jgi:hypothetical protein